MVDDGPGDVDSGGALDALQPWRGVHFQYQRAGARSQQIDACNLQPQDFGGTLGGPFLSGGETNPAGLAAAVQVGAELRLGLPVMAAITLSRQRRGVGARRFGENSCRKSVQARNLDALRDETVFREHPP